MLAVTGANGFVGAALCREAAARGVEVVALTRRSAHCPGATQHRVLGDLGHEVPTPDLFGDVGCVVHCAAMVHVMDQSAASNMEEFRRVNRDGTLALAQAAAAAGVRRFVFLSTAKVLGERTDDRPFHHDDPLAPADAYSASKAEAEVALRKLVSGTGMELVIVRPPLVHGPGAGGNLAALVRLLRLRVPLPLGSVRNRRAVLGLQNLVDALLYLSAAPQAAGEVVLLRDEPVLSTPEIVRSLAEGLQVGALLIPFPESALHFLARIAGREAYVTRVLDSLDLSLDHTREVVGWAPKVSAQDGLRQVGHEGRRR